ncbi:DUF899 domain-containing protein [Shouchella patagoniensis]|uniref:DUF899 domain-containing protein n=1 Tax=Shouchella patagoniensis TaxID=228576 RepID=UPI000995B52D|nr:DUF899 domain-containing protein [Shouchella patagoniensis]
MEDNHCRCNSNRELDEKIVEERLELDVDIVSQGDWQKAQLAFREKEKALTRARDQLNAERRRLPMLEVEKDYYFDGDSGTQTLKDLFAGYRQLIIYHFMFDPGWEEGCDGCSMMVDNMGDPAHLNARDTRLALVSRAPLKKIKSFKERMGWRVPWYSSYSSEFNKDFGATIAGQGEVHGYSVFLKNENRIYRTYSTWNRGVEYLGSNWSYLDLTSLGRQEDWEDSPAWVKQTKRYMWWRHRDQYGNK